jgi:hypothetical protein
MSLDKVSSQVIDSNKSIGEKDSVSKSNKTFAEESPAIQRSRKKLQEMFALQECQLTKEKIEETKARFSFTFDFDNNQNSQDHSSDIEQKIQDLASSII